MVSTIIVKTDSKLKAKAQKIAADMGLTLTSVVNNSLEEFVQKKSVLFWKNYTIKPQNPYGIFKGEKISEKDINEITHNWDKIIDELA